MVAMTSEKQFIKTMKLCKGMHQLIAEKLGITRQAVSKRIKENPRINAAYEETLEANIDYAETHLLKKINDGDTTALIFFLKCKAKNRGYVERQEFTGKDGGPIETETKINWLPMPDDNG